MRDFVAAIAAMILFAVALSLATSLQRYRSGHARLRRQIRSRGQSIVAEIPNDNGLAFFTVDDNAFHWAGQNIQKTSLMSVQVLINGAPISTSRSRSFKNRTPEAMTSSTDNFDGVRRDRWDVAIETTDRQVIIECGTIRDRVSQELARDIFEVVRSEIDSHD